MDSVLLKLGGLWSQELAGKDLLAKYRHLLFSDFIDVHPICIMRSPHLIEHHDDFNRMDTNKVNKQFLTTKTFRYALGIITFV